MTKTLQLSEKQKLKEIISHNLPVYRKDRGFSQVELAEMIGITQAFYSKIELGSALMSLEVYYKLVDILGIDAGALLREKKSSDTINNIVVMLQNSSQQELEIVEQVIKCLLKELEKFTNSDKMDK